MGVEMMGVNGSVGAMEGNTFDLGERGVVFLTFAKGHEDVVNSGADGVLKLGAGNGEIPSMRDRSVCFSEVREGGTVVVVVMKGGFHPGVEA